MGIETDQIVMSNKVAGGESHSVGRYDIKISGFFADNGRYPNNNVTWTHGDTLTTQDVTGTQLTEGREAGSKIFQYTNMNSYARFREAQNLLQQKDGTFVHDTDNKTITVSWDALEPTYAPSFKSDGISVSQTAGKLSSLGDAEL